MNTEFYAMTLWIAVAWPLLLAIPALHTRLPWSRHLAIVPAAVLTVLPGDVMLAVPWLLFGTGFAIDNDIRWILAMSVAIWFTAATVAIPAKRDPIYNYTTTLFLLTLTGNLGAILTTELVGFFSFSTLMGYGFYGLLVKDGDKTQQRAGRPYLIFLIIADLALFEALLLATTATGDLRYEIVRQAITENTAAQFYLWMVLLGFAFKAGIWPFHLWLLATFKSTSLSKSLLLGGVPVAMGLLGAVRWLPIGAYTFYALGIMIQIIGVTAILYVGLKLFKQASVKLLPALITILGSGLFTLALGTGLAHPSVWHQFEHLSYPFIATLGIFLTAVSFIVKHLSKTPQQPDFELQKENTLGISTKQGLSTLQYWAKDKLFRLQSHWHILWLKAVARYEDILHWKESPVFVAGWRLRITLFVLLGLVLAWLAG